MDYTTGYVWDQKSSKWIKIGGDSNSAKMYQDTTNNWDLQPKLLSEKNTIYVYTDYKEYTDEVGNKTYAPALKIGDGSTYVVDLPFAWNSDSDLWDSFEDHINNLTIHVSQAEKDFWNNKCRVYKSDVEKETIVFTTT